MLKILDKGGTKTPLYILIISHHIVVIWRHPRRFVLLAVINTDVGYQWMVYY